jgi:RimJ/RimL family protein N-acetyltransferase
MTEFDLRTERLLLRPLTSDDIEDLLVYRSDPETCRYLPFEPMDEREVARRLREQWSDLSLERPGSNRTLGAVELATGRLVGDVVLIRDAHHRDTGEIGYVFAESARGRGYATEAGRALLELAFDGLGMHRVTGRLDARNPASARVLERLGMRREAEFVEDDWFKGEWSSTLIYGLLDREWRAARGLPKRDRPETPSTH